MVAKDKAAVVMPRAIKFLEALQAVSKIVFICVWNLAAVHRPLHAMRNAPTTRPGLHQLAVRHYAIHEHVHTMLANKSQNIVLRTANGFGNLKDVTTLP